MKTRNFLLASAFAIGSAQAAITVTASGTLANSTVASGEALEGAQFVIQTVFSGTSYVSDGTAFPVALGDAASTTITISGASNAALNGTFSHYAGSTTSHYYPSYAGLYGGAADFGILYFDLGGGNSIGVGLWAAATPSGSTVTVGAPIQLSDFSNGSILPAAGQNETTFMIDIGGQDGVMEITGGSFTAVPEPGAAALLFVGSIGFLRRRRAARSVPGFRQ